MLAVSLGGSRTVGTQVKDNLLTVDSLIGTFIYRRYETNVIKSTWQVFPNYVVAHCKNHQAVVSYVLNRKNRKKNK